MSSTKKKLEELNVIDDFLMNRLASDASIGEEFCRLLLSTLLQRKIGKVAVTVQKVIPPFSPERKGIRMDVRVEEAAESMPLRRTSKSGRKRGRVICCGKNMRK